MAAYMTIKIPRKDLRLTRKIVDEKVNRFIKVSNTSKKGKDHSLRCMSLILY